MKRLFANARKAAAAAVVAMLGTAVLASCGPEKADPVKLATPQPALLSSTETSLAFSWDKVANAVQYSYTLTASDGTAASGGTTADNSIEFTGLASSTAYTLTLTAYPEVDSEDYLTSDAATLTVNTADIPPVTELWSVVGTVDDGAGYTWDVTLVAYNDGNYTIKKWYNTEGYDLNFSVNSDATISVLNQTVEDDYYYVAAGADKTICIDTRNYEDYGSYSNFSGDEKSGDIWFYNYETSGYYELTWPATPTEGGSVTIDELVGTYTQANDYQFFYSGDWSDYSSTNDITITKVDDNTISISGFVWSAEEDGLAFNATVDQQKGVITIAPQMISQYYKLAAKTGEGDSVTATWKDGSITFGKWCLYLDGYAYAYSTSTVLTKK